MKNSKLIEEVPMAREFMEYDVVIVGAGPSGLATAIRLKQMATKNKQDLSVCIVEKGSEVGAHILSGAVMEPRALNELLPNWKDLDAPVKTLVTDDQFLFLTRKKSYRLPTPSPMQNQGNYIISLANLCRWLASQAENLGVEIYPGFAAIELLFDDKKTIKGVATGAMGIDKNGDKTAQYQEGMELHAKKTVFAEGCRGSLTKVLFDAFHLRDHVDPQTYGLGLKETWEIDPKQHHLGRVIHSIGWPLDQKTYGGSFLYHLDDNKVSVGFVVGLDYENPYLSPFEEFQRFKTHPTIRPIFEGGKRIAYGAKAISEGGLQSLPKLNFPGGLIVGDGAGFLNVPKIKGIHTALKSGMVAAESIFAELYQSTEGNPNFQTALQKTWLWKELNAVRNIRPGFKHGLWVGLLNAALETYILRGHSAWTLRNHADHNTLKLAKNCQPIAYPKPDNTVTFDRLSSVYLSNTNHEENQPCHLQLQKPDAAISINYYQYASPETRYCPAAVYEIVTVNQQPCLQINAQNCVHCKSCDIKDPTQNINWVPPEGGGGPNYSNM